MNGNELPSRAALRRARRIVIKAGTSIVSTQDGRPSLTRLGSIVEQISHLMHNGIEVIFVSSGAVGMGKRLLQKQGRLKMSFSDFANHADDDDDEDGGRKSKLRVSRSYVSLLEATKIGQTPKEKKMHYDSACAAAGQFEMMNLYSRLFDQCDISASQILMTRDDFKDEGSLHNMTYSIDRLCALGMLPIINENDAVSANQGYTDDDVFSDNDGLAALCARNFGADVLLLLTDVDGVYDRPPNEDGAKVIDVWLEGSTKADIGEKSLAGRGGMSSKIDAALKAVKPGSSCTACVVTDGSSSDCILSIMKPQPSSSKPKGTLFVTPGSDLEQQVIKEKEAKEANIASVSEEARQKAVSARSEARTLQSLPYSTRQSILNTIATSLLQNESTLLQANATDLARAETDNIAPPLIRRLRLTHEKLQTLATGIRQIASNDDPLHVVKAKRELADGLVLSEVTVPIGVLMIIFESRPDSLPQISALALASGNGLLLKGGKEATESNKALHKVIGDAIEEGSGGKVKRDIIALVTSRGQVADMLSLDDVIDLVIPRGSNSLVNYIKQNTRIPVLGHADGVCHVYIDKSATDAEAACQIVIDAKTGYASACNAMETLLLHQDTLKNGGMASTVLMSLRAAGVKCLGGPRAMKEGLCDVAAKELKCEYGDLTCMVEVVGSVDEAIDWIHTYGSGHTESIICGDDDDVGEEFLNRVDAACVFKNASTRFSDGFRFGLGAEVGISTGRIHARGPVGVEGLLTTKWQLRSTGANSVDEYGGDTPKKTYTHKELM